MVYFEKSQPAPTCLAVEKAKKNGDYKCGDVLHRLQADFMNKCYICEQRGISSINVEHFVAHEGEQNLMFDWNNLFWACGHCNNTKSNQFQNLLNCTIKTDNIEDRLSYSANLFPHGEVEITALDTTDTRTVETAKLLNLVYTGTTVLKSLEANNIQDAIRDEMILFLQALTSYCKTTLPDVKAEKLIEIRTHLHRSSAFTAFKRWVIRSNPKLKTEFGQYID